MHWTITIATRVLIVLGYLVGTGESAAMGGEAAGRVSLVLAGIVLSAFLFYVALSGPTVALLSRLRRRHRRPAAPVLSEVTGSVPPRS
jgi:uncharacterized membrane protein YhaH (DUF805 family)